MTFEEKSLYHQIHPLKLLIDIGTTFPALYLFWQHQLVGALIVTIIPSILASAFVMCFATLEPYKRSSMGRYIHTYMTPVVVALRIIGLVVMCVAAWLQIFLLILAGLAIVILAWMRGILFPLHVTTWAVIIIWTNAGRIVPLLIGYSTRQLCRIRHNLNEDRKSMRAYCG